MVSHLSHLVSESVMMIVMVIVMTMITYGVSDSGSVMMSPCSSACVSPVSSMGQGNGWVLPLGHTDGHWVGTQPLLPHQPEPTCPRCRAEQLLWAGQRCTALHRLNGSIPNLVTDTSFKSNLILSNSCHLFIFFSPYSAAWKTCLKS